MARLAVVIFAPAGGGQDRPELFEAGGLGLQRLAAGAQAGDGLVNDDQDSVRLEPTVVAPADGLEGGSAAVGPAGGVVADAVGHVGIQVGHR